MDATLVVVLAIAVLLIVLGFVALLKQKLYVDSNTGQVTEVELPLIGKLRTNAPAIMFVACGAVLTYVVLDRSLNVRETVEWQIEGQIQLPDDAKAKLNCPQTQGVCLAFQDGTLRFHYTPMEDLDVADDGNFKFRMRIPKGVLFEQWIEQVEYSHPGLTDTIPLFRNDDSKQYVDARTETTRTLKTVTIPAKAISTQRLEALAVR